jgi:hypothetical protein
MVMACGRAVVKDVRDSDGPADDDDRGDRRRRLRGRSAAGYRGDRAFAQAA